MVFASKLDAALPCALQILIVLEDICSRLPLEYAILKETDIIIVCRVVCGDFRLKY